MVSLETTVSETPLPDYEAKRAHQQQNNKKALRKLWLVMIMTVIFVGVEVFGGWIAHSIAVMSDAAHLASDALGVAISIVALKIAERSANKEYTYGYHRAEVLGALASILFIWLITLWLIVEATERFFNPPKIDGKVMLIVAGLCLLFNLV